MPDTKIHHAQDQLSKFCDKTGKILHGVIIP